MEAGTAHDADGPTPGRRDAGRVVIIGGGLAGFSAAEALRDLGHEGAITVVDAEPGLYDRPPLSKQLFQEGFGLQSVEFAGAERLALLQIEVLTRRTATALDAAHLAVTLDSGQRMQADTVLLATGGRARALTVPGADLPAVRTLRTMGDALALRDETVAGDPVVVIGGGLIGAEVASSLRAAGAAVTIVDPAPVPMVPAVGPTMAAHLHAEHALHGIAVLVGAAAAIEPGTDGAVTVVLADGVRLPARLVIVGIGIVPNVELAVAAGLDVDDGILVDTAQRTSAANIYAAGDVARRRGPDGSAHRREEHWEAAQLSGRAAAAAMLGLPIPDRGAPWFWSDRHGTHLEVVGRLIGDGVPVVRGGGPHPAVFLVDDGRLVGAASLDDSNAVRAARRLIDRGVPVRPADLADPAVSLRSLVQAAR